MEPSTTIRFRWTVDELLQAHRYHFRHTCRPVFRIALHLVFALIILAGYGLFHNGKSVAVGIAFIIVGIYCLAIRPFERRWMTRRQFAKRPDKDTEIEWQVAPDRIAARSNLGYGEYGWDAFAKAVRSPAGLILYSTDQVFHWLPRHAFNCDADYERVVELARSRVRRFHDVN